MCFIVWSLSTQRCRHALPAHSVSLHLMVLECLLTTTFLSFATSFLLKYPSLHSNSSQFLQTRTKDRGRVGGEKKGKREKETRTYKTCRHNQ